MTHLERYIEDAKNLQDNGRWITEYEEQEILDFMDHVWLQLSHTERKFANILIQNLWKL